MSYGIRNVLVMDGEALPAIDRIGQRAAEAALRVNSYVGIKKMDESFDWGGHGRMTFSM